MATANLSSKESVDTTKDSVVITKNLETVAGGRTLDVTGFSDEEISAGHVIIKETATSEFKPLPTNGTKPAGHDYAGILVASLKTHGPLVNFASFFITTPLVVTNLFHYSSATLNY